MGRAVDLLPGGDHLPVLDFLHDGAHLAAGHRGCRRQSGGCGAPQAGAPPPGSHTEGSSDPPTPSRQDEAESYLPGWAVRPGTRSTGWPGCGKGEGACHPRALAGSPGPREEKQLGRLGVRGAGQPDQSQLGERGREWRPQGLKGTGPWAGKGHPNGAQRHFAANQGFTRIGLSTSNRA